MVHARLCIHSQACLDKSTVAYKARGKPLGSFHSTIQLLPDKCVQCDCV